MSKNSNEINDLRNIIETMKNDPNQVNELKKEVEKRNLQPKIKEFERQYGDKISEMMQEINAKGEMSDEEKARMILDMKKKLPKDTQKQLSSVISAMKNYIRNV